MKHIASLLLIAVASTAVAQDKFQKSTPGASTAQLDIIFKNTTSQPVSLMWVDFNGKEVELSKIPAAGTIEANSQCGHLWRVKQNGHAISNFRVSESAKQTFEIKTPTAGKPPTIKTGSPPMIKPTLPAGPAPPTIKKSAGPPPPPMLKKKAPGPPPPPSKVAAKTPFMTKPAGKATLPPPPKPTSVAASGPKVSKEWTTWRDVEDSTFQKQPDGSWMLSAKGELARICSQYERFTEKSRSEHSIVLLDSKGREYQLYSGTVIVPDPTLNKRIAGLPGNWTHKSAAARLPMTFWKGSADGMTVTKQPDGSWLYFKPNTKPYAVFPVSQEDRYIIFEDPTRKTSFILCDGIALIHDEATGSYSQMTTGAWVK